MRSDTNSNLCSLFISLMNLCAHKFRNSTRVKKRSIIVILVWSAILKPYGWSIVYYLWPTPYFYKYKPILLYVSIRIHVLPLWKVWMKNITVAPCLYYYSIKCIQKLYLTNFLYNILPDDPEKHCTTAPLACWPMLSRMLVLSPPTG